MKSLPTIFQNNRAWADQQLATDPKFFEQLCLIHDPDYLWIGCSDSRVPANQIVGLAPGELFVHRNVANIVSADDPNAGAVLQYAVESLHVKHIIVCGHYACGGVAAALGPAVDGPLEQWLAPLRAVRQKYAVELEQLADHGARWRRLCELNVIEQVAVVQALPVIAAAWQEGKPLAIHGWIYDLRDGLLRDLDVTTDSDDV